MKRIKTIFSDKIDSLKREIRLRKVESSLNNAKLNFEEDKRTAELKLEELTIKLVDSDSVESVISDMFDCIGTIEKCETGIKRADRILEYLNEDVES